MVRGLYFLLTPVDPAILRKVNCLLLGGIVLPSCVLTAQVRPRPSSLEPLALFHLKQFTQHSFFVFQPDSDAEKPYITSDYSFDLTGAGKLRVYKGLMRPSQLGMWPRCPSSPSRQTQCWDWIFNFFSLISRFIRTEVTLLTSDTVTWTWSSPVVDKALVCRWHSWSKPARP